VDSTQRVDDQPALYYALKNLDTSSAALLLDRASVPSINMHWPGMGPLHWLAFGREGRAKPLEMTRVLLDHGADANDLDSDQRTALHYAAAGNDLDLARVLLDHRADPNQRSGPPHYEPCGPPFEDVRPVLRTPLHEALEKRHVELALYLIQHGANPALEERDGLTALDLVPAPEQAEVIAQLGKLPHGSRRKLSPKQRSLLGP
jgi:ankyrin repeat protein